MTISRNALNALNFSLATLVGFFCIAIALMSLINRGPWIDEFVTIAWTTPNTLPREFLSLMVHEVHPILRFGLIYLVQHAGITDIIVLRSLNIVGVPLLLVALVYAFRQHAVNLS